MFNFLRVSIIITAIFGYTLGYNGIYMFHIIVLFWILISTLYINDKIVIQNKKLLYPLFIIWVYSILSILWHPDFFMWAKYQFYLLCGYFTILAIYQTSTNQEQLFKVFKIIVIFLGLNLFIGLLESFELIRLPMSRLSPYASLFGVDGMELDNFSEDKLETLMSKPTGFNFNPNTFGFVMIICTPFILFYKNLAIKSFGLIIITLMLINIGSKSHFISFFIMLTLVPIYYQLNLKKIVLVFVSIFLVSIVSYIFFFSNIDIDVFGLNRLLELVRNFDRVMDIFISLDTSGGDSTATRAALYIFGLQNLYDSYGMGVGFGGIQAKLIEVDFVMKAFHFFFLQLLVDFGIPMFIFIMYFYFKLALRLKKISLSHSIYNKNFLYLARSLSLSLFIAIPASIAPSGVHYVLPFYILIGLSISLLKIYYMEYKNENINFS